MFSFALKIRSSVVTATALIASVSLVLGRPQDRQLQARDPTDDFVLNLNADKNAFTVPSPSDFLPSSPDGISPPPIDFSNFDFETLSALPQAPETANNPFGPVALSTDWTKTGSLPVNGAFGAPAVAVDPWWPGSGPSINLATDAVKKSVNLISSGQRTYGFFGVSTDKKNLVPTGDSTDEDWGHFSQAVMKAPPSYALHRSSRGLLLIYTDQNNINLLTDQQAGILIDNFEGFQQFVVHTSSKTVYPAKVFDEQSLQNAIGQRYSAPSLLDHLNQLLPF